MPPAQVDPIFEAPDRSLAVTVTVTVDSTWPASPSPSGDTERTTCSHDHGVDLNRRHCMAIVWKAQSVRYSRGEYWNIRARKNGRRINLSLGYVNPVEALRAAEQMTLEERMGRAPGPVGGMQRNASRLCGTSWAILRPRS